MVYTFKVTSPEKSEFMQLIEIAPNCTFSDFHALLQKSSNFDSDQLASFFTVNSRQHRQNEISFLETARRANPPKYPMTKTQLRELITQEGQLLLYIFDFFNDRFYQLELVIISMEKTLDEPFVSYQKGNAPQQTLPDDTDDDTAETIQPNDYLDYGEFDDYSEIFGEMNDLIMKEN